MVVHTGGVWKYVQEVCVGVHTGGVWEYIL